MVKAYVLIKVDGVDINKVANKLKEDVIEKITKIKGVSETSCMIVADED